MLKDLLIEDKIYFYHNMIEEEIKKISLYLKVGKIELVEFKDVVKKCVLIRYDKVTTDGTGMFILLNRLYSLE